MKTKILAFMSAAAVIIPFVHPSDASAVSFTMKRSLHSESALIYNLDSDNIIHEKNADKKQMPGPLVNIMTAVVCLENCSNLGERITIDEEVYSSLYDTEYPDDLRYAEIYNNDELTYTDLLYAMMLTSSIEASQTIAYNIGGESVSAFVQLMNDKAEEIGMTSTHFTNPTGMYDKDQYTTAYDMALLTKYAMKLSRFEDICSTYEYTPSVPNSERHLDREAWRWYHSNVMMDEENTYYYRGVRGVKTANLEMGGRNIIAMASRDGHNYLVVAMHAPMNDEDGDTAFYHLEDARDMFDWAFDHFSYQVVLAETAELGELPVNLADGHDYVLARPKEELSLLWSDEIDLSLISRDKITWYENELQAPVKKGQPLGTVTLEYSGEDIATVELVAVSDVERSAAKYNLYAAKMFPKSDWFKKAFLIMGLLCGVYIIICIYSYVLFKNRSKPIKPMYAVPKVDKKKRSSGSRPQNRK